MIDKSTTTLRTLVKQWREDADRIEAMAEAQKLDRGEDPKPGRFELELRERVRTLRKAALDLNCALNAQSLMRIKRQD